MSNDAPVSDPAPDLGFGPANRLSSLFWISVLGLFVELMLIRWIGTEIRIFAYLQNTVLVVCFLGMGVGCFLYRRPVAMRSALVPFGLLTGLLSIPFTREALSRVTSGMSALNDFIIWYQTPTARASDAILPVTCGLIASFSVLLFVLYTFVPIGQALGRLLCDHPRIVLAYSVNVAGSLVGIWIFVALSFLSAPPLAWVAVALALFYPFLSDAPGDRSRERMLVALVLVAALPSLMQGDALSTAWSCYQKLGVFADSSDPQSPTRTITINNVRFQGILDLSTDYTRKHRSEYPEEQEGLSQYDVPFLLHPKPAQALLVGAGSGNDAAGALRQGVQHVVAVEIDPVIIQMGREMHPERPYASDRVTVVNDDARSYFATTPEKFDVISFGLLDSHTTGAVSNARLDHYVYTQECIRRVRELLRPGGLISLTFEPQKPFIADRMARVLKEAFGAPPLVVTIPANSYGWGGTMMLAGDLASVNARLAAQPRLSKIFEQWKAAAPPLTYTTTVTTDDWPYIYLEAPRIPVLFGLLAGLLLALYAYACWRLGVGGTIGRGWTRVHWHFFFLGAAFMLLEVQNVSKACAVLGSTWLVNAVIISSVLTMVLLANAVVAAMPNIHLGLVYAALGASSLALYFFDVAQLAFLPYASKSLALGGLTCLPMFFAGIVFVCSFERVRERDEALGANLFGSLVGGLLQSATFLTGIRALQLVVLALYGLAALTRPARKDSSAG